MESRIAETLQFINGGAGCYGCGACEQRCPRSCITMVSDRNGFPYPAIDRARCVKCGICRSVCPAGESAFRGGEAAVPQLGAARLRDPEQRLRSSSGGLFRALSDAILARGGAVAGTAFNAAFEAETVVAETPAERDRLLGSKYVQSRNRNAYVQIIKLLKTGRNVLFCGTPCQCAGLYGALGKNPENLYTVDFVCHGAPSPAVFSSYLEHLAAERQSPVVQVNFRDKTGGWAPLRLTVSFANGDAYSAAFSEDPYYRFFLAGGMNRKSCYQCPFTRLEHRESDLTAADAWRAGNVRPGWDDNTGISTVLVNSSKGARLLESVRDELEFVPCELAAIDQGYLHRPAAVHPDRPEFFAAFRTRGAAAALADFARVRRPLVRRLRGRIAKIFRKWTGKPEWIE